MVIIVKGNTVAMLNNWYFILAFKFGDLEQGIPSSCICWLRSSLAPTSRIIWLRKLFVYINLNCFSMLLFFDVVMFDLLHD